MPKKSTRLEVFQEILKENNITANTIEKSDTLIRAIQKEAEAVKDYRHPSYIKHPLSDIIMIVFFAVLGNANEWGEVESFARKKEKWLRKYLELPYGIPTDDTYRIVMGNINTEHFFQVTVNLLIQTIEEILEVSEKKQNIHEKTILSVDGKVSCGSGRTESAKGEIRALQTLNVYANDYQMCVGQKVIEEKTNEIPAAQEILQLMDLKGTIVTADAMNCQRETAAAIIRGKGDYVLALKGNQPLFYEEVRAFFDKEEQEKLRERKGCYKRTAEPEHGGIAIREYYITSEVDWYEDRKKWSGLCSFGMVHKTVKKANGNVEEENRYYVCSIGENVEEFERAARGHWGVENNLHWHLDFTFQDDKNKSMEKTGAKNMQIMKKIALSILGMVKESYKISMKRIRYELSLDYEDGIEKMLSLLDIGSVKNKLQSTQKSPVK